MKKSLLSTALLSLLCTGVLAQESIAPSDVLLSKINPLLTSQANTIRYFDAPADMIAVGVVTKSFDKRVYYTTANGDVLLSGMMFDVDEKKSFNDQVLSQLKVLLPETWTTPLTELETITFGSGDNHIYAFVDVSCGFCHRLHKEVKERAEKGLMDNITMHYVMINIMDPNKQMSVESMLGQADAEQQFALFDKALQNQNIPVDAESQMMGKEKLSSNKKAFNNFPMASGVPFVIGKINGSWEISKGVPNATFYAQFEQSSDAMLSVSTLPVEKVAP